MYQLTSHNHVIRLTDNVVIPPDLTNKDRVEYELWLALGNSPLPATVVDSKVVARWTLEQLEATTLMNRGLREFLLVAMQDLAQRQAVILGNGVTAQQILAGNSAWLRLVQIDTQATQLRALL